MKCSHSSSQQPDEGRRESQELLRFALVSVVLFEVSGITAPEKHKAFEEKIHLSTLERMSLMVHV